MSNRVKLKKTYKKYNKKYFILNKFVVILMLVIIITFILIYYFSKKATPILMNYAVLETKKLATVIINRAVSKQIASEISLDELIVTEKNSNDEIQSIDFNPYIVNKVLNSVTNTIQLNLKWLEEGKVDMIELPENITINNDNLKKGIIYEIPVGIITNNAFFANLGPKIPVRLNLVGSVECGVETKVKDYGINNAIIEVVVNAKVSEQVVLPFDSEVITISTDIPVAIKIIEGKVPDYYSNGLSNSSNFSIPIDE